MTDIVERILAEENRHIIGYPSPRRNVAELLRAAREDIERLTRELSEARATALEEAAKYHDDKAAYFANLANDPKCRYDIRWNSCDEAWRTMMAYSSQHDHDAAAIRALKEVKG